jgi:hypothetical protein
VKEPSSLLGDQAPVWDRRQILGTAAIGALSGFAASRYDTEVESAVEGSVTIDVRAFGAVGDGTHDDGPAFMAAAAEVLRRSGGGGTLLVPAPPVAYVSEDVVRFHQPGLRIVGEGARVRMQFEIGDPSGGAIENRGSVSGLSWQFDDLIDGRHAITVSNTRQYEITACTFDRADRAINLAPSVNAGFHSVAGISVHHNRFLVCNYHIFGADQNEWSDAAISDCSFSDNTCQIARVKNVYIEQIDGIHIVNNVTFMLGYRSDNPSLALKEQSIHIGSSNGVQIHNNNLFEPGLEGILLETARGVNVTGNWIARAGQRELRSAVRIVGTPSATINVTGNQLDLYSLHGVELAGSAASPPNLSGNIVRFDPELPTYLGPDLSPDELDATNHAGIFVAEDYLGPLPLLGSHFSESVGEGIQIGPLGSGVRSYTRHARWSVTEVQESRGLRFGRGQQLVVAMLSDASNDDRTFGGLMLITAKSVGSSSRQTSTYAVLVGRSSLDAGLVPLGQVGDTSGGGAQDPAFRWSLSGRALVATALGAAAGQFDFEILAIGNVMAL